MKRIGMTEYRKINVMNGESRTSVTILENLFQLLSLKLTGEVNQVKAVSKYINHELKEYMGGHEVQSSLAACVSRIAINGIVEPELKQQMQSKYWGFSDEID
jgi:hypothetical protein